MKIVLGWLNQLLTDDLSANEAVVALDKAGLEVEDVIRPPAFDEKIVTVTIEKIKPHPNADRLQVATVEQDGETLEIVCGAPNIYEGQRVVLAPVGSKLPDGTKIEPVEIRGAKSQGMLCSEKELGLGGDHDGLLDLGSETPAGVPLQEIFSTDQVVVDTKTAANRWDLQGYHGIAQEVAAHTGVGLELDKTVQSHTKAKRTEDLFVNHLKEQVPCYSLLKLKIDDRQQESPAWMQRYLRLHGMRPLNVVVDITNFVMLETGQPLHAFDAKSVKGKIQIRFAENGEKITTLDNVERILSSSDIVIADEKRPIALAGVIGGEDAEIQPGTKEVLLEIATFDGAHVRKSAKRNGLRTEASARFERDIPTQAVKGAARRVVELLQRYVEAELVSYQNELNQWPWVQHIGIQTNKLQSFLGVEVEEDKIVSSLNELGFEVESFDISTEARKHLGKPYKLGARFREDGVDAFDCSYLVDYLYSLIGVHVGHTALGQYEIGTKVELADIRPGDAVFYKGKIDESTATDHYYTLSPDKTHVKHDLSESKHVGHVGIYVGDNKVVHATRYLYEEEAWKERKRSGVIETELEEFSDNPDFLGVRRFVEDLEGYVRVTVPWWRPDVAHPTDIYEEVIKLVGLDQLPSTLPAWRPQALYPDSHWGRISTLRYGLQATGLFEVTTYPFLSEDDVKLSGYEAAEHFKLENPRSAEQAYLRTSLLPQMLNVVVNNTTHKKEFGLFEIARVFIKQAEDQQPNEQLKLGVIWVHTEAVMCTKGVLDHVLHLAHIDATFRQVSDAYSYLHPSQQAVIETSGGQLGYYGQLHPDVLDAYKLKAPAAFLEIDAQALIGQWRDVDFEPLARFPSGYRDINVRVSLSVPWQQVKDSLARIGQVRCAFKDEFRQDQGKVLTVHVEIMATDRTPTDKDIQAKLEEIRKTLQQDVGAEVEI